MEMEVPALLCNFGIIGFILYFGPFLTIFLYGIYKIYKNRKNIEIDSIMYLTGVGLAIILSSLSGYVFFNISSMTMAIISLKGLLFSQKEPTLSQKEPTLLQKEPTPMKNRKEK